MHQTIRRPGSGSGSMHTGGARVLLCAADIACLRTISMRGRPRPFSSSPPGAIVPQPPARSTPGASLIASRGNTAGAAASLRHRCVIAASSHARVERHDA